MKAGTSTSTSTSSARFTQHVSIPATLDYSRTTLHAAQNPTLVYPCSVHAGANNH